VAILDSIGVNASLLGPNFYRQIRQKFITRNILKWDSNAQTELAMVDAGWIAEACRTVGQYIVRSLKSDFSSESELSKLTLFAFDSDSACSSVLEPDISESVQLLTHFPSLALCLRLDRSLNSIENNFGVRTLLESYRSFAVFFRSFCSLSVYLLLMVRSLLELAAGSAHYRPFSRIPAIELRREMLLCLLQLALPTSTLTVHRLPVRQGMSRD